MNYEVRNTTFKHTTSATGTDRFEKQKQKRKKEILEPFGERVILLAQIVDQEDGECGPIWRKSSFVAKSRRKLSDSECVELRALITGHHPRGEARRRIERYEIT